ncbi:uncharacterized protein A4U43_C10F1460 [Asparagus officinalis]|uniref:Uncharacterized protein n=1 Tax=Asparagus officinalis TaxID=4686 RepID=A0A5P1E310_ASPOF|nr:uncharacterized protein A4U43_C10F1460 [Asparagus officinalis]
MEFYQELLFTAILSVLLVSLLGPSTEIADEKRGNDSLRSDPISSAEARSDHDKKCEEGIGIEKFDGDLVDQDEIAEVRVREEYIMISRGLEAARSTMSEPETENEAAGTGSGETVVEAMKREIGDASVGDMRESKGSEPVEAEELQLALEKEVDAHGIETEAKAEEAGSITIEENVGDDVERAGAFLGKAIEGAGNVVEVKKEEIDDDSTREML